MNIRNLMLTIALVAAAAAYELGYLSFAKVTEARPSAEQKSGEQKRTSPAPAVTVAPVVTADLNERVRITGTLVPRLEILVAPEIEGLRVVELLADEGDLVVKGQVLARLEQETLKVQLAQNDASQARADAAIAQARSNIISAEAREVEARRSLDRANQLKGTSVLTEATVDQRESAARTAAAALRSARDGLVLAQADRNLVDAQRRDIEWKLSRTEVKSPSDGVINRRATRIGGLASGTAVAEPMFRIIADGDVELEAEVPEVDISALKAGQKATLTLADGSEVMGSIRLVSPEVDKSTRLGKVRVSLGRNPVLRIGSFARGAIETRSVHGLIVPTSAVLYGSEGASVMLVSGTRVAQRKVTVGLDGGDRVEIRAGLAEGDRIVAKAGTFLREGDIIVPVAGGLGAPLPRPAAGHSTGQSSQ